MIVGRYGTPLRYPGGKQKLAPFVQEILAANDLLGGDYSEPYAGGAGVAIELLLSGAVSRIHLNDSSQPIVSFWKSILTETEAFCRRISVASLTVKEWRRQREVMLRPSDHSVLDVGFSAFFLNRVNRSGILTGGLIGGLHQTGDWRMGARFPRSELIRRVESIASHKKNIKVRGWDAERFLTEYVPRLPAKTLVYCDPPYFNADRLYLNHYKLEDHRRIASTLQNLKRGWILSYDLAPEILRCYQARRAFTYSLQYNANTAYLGTEVFLFSDHLKIPKRSKLAPIDEALRSDIALRTARSHLRHMEKMSVTSSHSKYPSHH